MLRAPTNAPRTSARPAASRPSKLLAPLRQQQRQQQRVMAPTSAVNELFMLAEIDWTDPDTQIGVLGGVLGLALGIGAPVFYSMRDDADEKRLEELRSLNRETFKETGEYLSSVRDVAGLSVAGGERRGGRSLQGCGGTSQPHVPSVRACLASGAFECRGGGGSASRDMAAQP